MQQFDLSLWLQDKSRKVVTRDGRVVKILDTEFESGNGNKSVLAKCIYNNKAAVYVYTTDGKANNIDETENDIFFADEEEEDELTKFEKALARFAWRGINVNDLTKEAKEILHKDSKRLLDLARKELQPEFDKEMDKLLAETDKVVYQKGKQDALKDLPNWKKVDSNPPKVQYNLQGKRLYKNGEYYIELSDLEALPKEE